MLRPLEATPCLAAKGPTTTRARMAGNHETRERSKGVGLLGHLTKFRRRATSAARGTLRVTRCGAAALHGLLCTGDTRFFTCARRQCDAILDILVVACTKIDQLHLC